MGAGDPLGDGKFPDFDASKPNVARVYDAMLGGKDNFAADREFVAEVLRFAPMAPLGVISNRQFLRRVVRYLVVEAGVTQFIDLGSGLPTQGNVSEVVHQFSPRARVVHVDNDPVVGSMIDFGQPVGLLLFAILHHLEDSDHPEQLMAEWCAAMPSGSYLAISSLRLPGADRAEQRAVTIEGEKLMTGFLRPMRWREDSEIRSWFGDWELIPPDLVPLGDWRSPVQGCTPYPEIQHSFSGGVAKKR